MTGRTIAVGDVHGCFDELMDLIAAVQYRPSEDQLLFIGDLVDKGPASKKVVAWVRGMGAMCIKGNHEDKHVRFRKHVAKLRTDAAYKIPMKLADDVREVHDTLTDDDIAWFAALPKSIRMGEYGSWLFVHAGPDEGKEMFLRYVDKETGAFIPFSGDFTQPPNSVFWSRGPNWKAAHNVVYGHQPWATVRQEHKTHGIDTGCVYGGRLTALVFENLNATAVPEIVSVQSHGVYADLKQKEAA